MWFGVCGENSKVVEKVLMKCEVVKGGESSDGASKGKIGSQWWAFPSPSMSADLES